MRRMLCVVAASLLLACLTSVGETQERPYTEGPVTASTYLRIKPGMFDKYVNYLATEYKQLMEAQKKADVILDYAVYTSPQAHEGDWNMLLTVTYKNMAALDNLRDRTEPIMIETLDRTPDQAAQASIERGAMRDQVGSRLLRQLILK